LKIYLLAITTTETFLWRPR